MKILFYRYGSICEPDILECFKESGHETVEITTEITNKNTTYGDTLKIVNESLQNNPCDCVFSINYYPALSDVCNAYHIRYICWIVDSPVLELFDKSITNSWNRVFLFDKAQYEDIHHLNPSCIFHYPLAVNVKHKQACIESARTSNKRSKYSCDISFVGSLYSEKSPLSQLTITSDYLKGFIDGVTNAALKVYGYYIVDSLINDDIVELFKSSAQGYTSFPSLEYLDDKKLISQHYIGNNITVAERTEIVSIISGKYDFNLYTASNISGIPNAVSKGTCNTLTEMPVIFNNSKINLNPTAKSIRSGISLRTFDIMACEGFMLANYQTELCELFTPGVDFAYYDSIESIPDIIDYYLTHDNERKEIAHNAFIKVQNEYNYMLRLNGLLLKAFEC